MRQLKGLMANGKPTGVVEKQDVRLVEKCRRLESHWGRGEVLPALEVALELVAEARKAGPGLSERSASLGVPDPRGWTLDETEPFAHHRGLALAYDIALLSAM